MADGCVARDPQYMIPQFLMTGLPSVIFAVSELGLGHGSNKILVTKPAKTVGTNSVVIIFRCVGLVFLL